MGKRAMLSYRNDCRMAETKWKPRGRVRFLGSSRRSLVEHAAVLQSQASPLSLQNVN